MIMEKRVYCIIVTYNGMRWIKKCIDSLLASDYNNNIVVVDNGSKDVTAAFIKQNYPHVHLIETGKNLGFGQGNNIGLHIALEKKADHILLLNQDAYVEHDTIYKLVKAQTENPEFGILSPLHLNGAGNNFDEYFYNYLIKSDIKNILPQALLNNGVECSIINTRFVNAAAWLISSDCLKKTGGFDPIFFHYGEDDHYINRALYKGFKAGILTSAKICHERERSLENNSINFRLKFKRDWVIFLNLVCDIQQPKYIRLVIRRFLRHALLTIKGVISFNKEVTLYNFWMVKNIVRSFFKVRKSRMVSINSKIAHL